MIRRPPKPTRTATLCPYTTLVRSKLDGVFPLDPAGTSVAAKLSATGLRRGGLSIASLGAEVSMRGGTGQVRANLTGSRGRDFVFRSEEHTSELQSPMRISYAVFCLKKTKIATTT